MNNKIPADDQPGKKKKSGSKKGSPRSSGKRGKKQTHIKYRNRKYAQFLRGEWDKLGRKLKKLANKGGLRP